MSLLFARKPPAEIAKLQDGSDLDHQATARKTDVLESS